MIAPQQARQQIIALALAEDLGKEDASAALLPDTTQAKGRLICRDEHSVLFGRDWFDDSFHALSPACRIQWQVQDGDTLHAGQSLCTVNGPARALLSAERTALNLLQTLSATATTTRRWQRRIADLPVRLMDTRKTLPGLRQAQKQAVLAGGGHNQRIGLYDAILIKENHIATLGSIAAAIQAAQQRFPHLPLQIEVENLDEYQQALNAGARLLLLDNFPLADLRTAVQNKPADAVLEASGNINLDTLRAVAETGIDRISIGALTKHVQAVDFSLRLAMA